MILNELYLSGKMRPTEYLAPRVKNFLTVIVQGLLFPVPEGHKALNFETTSLGVFFPPFISSNC